MGRPGKELPHLSAIFDSVYGNSDESLVNLIFASLTQGSWKRYEVAAKLFLKFCHSAKIAFSFPIPDKVVIEFVVWVTKNRNLTCATIKSYLSALDHLATMTGHKGEKWFENDQLKIVLKGIKNLGRGTENRKEAGRAIRVSDLLKIRKRVANTNWSLGSKQSFWTCCLVAFYGSCRMSELLGELAYKFGNNSAFCWKDVVWISEQQVQITVRIPKTNRGSEKIDLFAFPKKSLCPVRALKNLEIAQKKSGLWAENLPVFRSSSGACLKKSNFAKSLKFLTKSEKLKNINLRSFRSGIPSLLERNPDLANDSHIKIWGRWKSKSYQTYMKGGNIGKKWIYQKIVAALLNEF